MGFGYMKRMNTYGPRGVCCLVPKTWSWTIDNCSFLKPRRSVCPHVLSLHVHSFVFDEKHASFSRKDVFWPSSSFLMAHRQSQVSVQIISGPILP